MSENVGCMHFVGREISRATPELAGKPLFDPVSEGGGVSYLTKELHPPELMGLIGLFWILLLKL